MKIHYSELEKLLPNNFLAEKMLLQCLIIEPKLTEFADRKLKKNAFYYQNHAEIFKILTHMYQKNLTITPLTFLIFVQENKLVEKVGGLQIVIELTYEIPNLIYLEECIEVINEKSVRRSLIKFAFHMIDLCSLTNKTLEEILQQIERDIFLLTHQEKSDQVFTSSQLVNKVFSNIKTNFLNAGFIGFPSGFQELDNLTQGFQKADLIILAGRPSMGKTAFSLSLILNSLKLTRCPILLFTVEMSKDQIMYRLLSLESNLSHKKLRTGQLQKEDWLKLIEASKVIAKLPLFINDNSNLSMSEIRSVIQKIQFEHNNIGLVVIDYLQLIQSTSPQFTNRVQEIAHITRSLKLLAREFNVPFLVLSQLSRQIETRIDQTPMLSDLRDSGSIEQDADVVLMLNNTQKSRENSINDTSNLIDLIIAKQRNGPLGIVQLGFSKKQMKFYNLSSMS